jgi:hypothetical protein
LAGPSGDYVFNYLEQMATLPRGHAETLDSYAVRAAYTQGFRDASAMIAAWLLTSIGALSPPEA